MSIHALRDLKKRRLGPDNRARGPISLRFRLARPDAGKPFATQLAGPAPPRQPQRHRRAVLVLAALAPSKGRATCGEECDRQYSSAIDDCRLQYGDDPADSDDPTNCAGSQRRLSKLPGRLRRRDDFAAPPGGPYSSRPASIDHVHWRASSSASTAAARRGGRPAPAPDISATTSFRSPAADPTRFRTCSGRRSPAARAKDHWERRACGR
jgi:hypothetical protein